MSFNQCYVYNTQIISVVFQQSLDIQEIELFMPVHLRNQLKLLFIND